MNSTTICFVVTKELKNKIKEEAKKKNISQNSLIRIAITEFLDRNK